MSYRKPHIVYYKDEQHPHVVFFQNPDGSWGQEGELGKILGLYRGKEKGSSSMTEAYEQLGIECAYNEDKFEICRKALVDLRAMNQAAAQRVDRAFQEVKDVTGHECLPCSAATTEGVVIDVSDDGSSMNEVPHAQDRPVRTPYTRSRSARDGKRGRGM